MIIAKLMGGLGNQLFQYAFSKNIALKNNGSLKFDLSYFEGNPFRSYELDHFRITKAIATRREIDHLKEKHFSKPNIYKRKLLKTRSYFVHEQGPLFNPDYFKLQKDVYIDGYWQSEKYFINSAVPIRNDLEFKSPPSTANQQMLRQITLAGNAVSIHIRRGDYIENQHAGIHGVCPLSYYTNAITMLVNKKPDAVFYVFSDDMDWAKQNLNLTHPTIFVDVNNIHTAFEDLRLMSACSHHIIANSSFSWWGAWLNPNPEKIVIAPKNWFADAQLNAKATSITPDSWIRI